MSPKKWIYEIPLGISSSRSHPWKCQIKFCKLLVCTDTIFAWNLWTWNLISFACFFYFLFISYYILKESNKSYTQRRSQGGARGGSCPPWPAPEFVNNSIILDFDVRKPKLPPYTYQKACYYKRKNNHHTSFCLLLVGHLNS